MRSTAMAGASSLAAVTVDAFGTCVELADPAEPLRVALAERGVRHDLADVRRAFEAEAAYYVPRSHLGRDAAGLDALRRECVAVFLAELGAELEVETFVPAFMAALVFRPIEGAADALDRLRAAGLALACVANWDVSLRGKLQAAGLAVRFDTVVSSAEAGAPKPDPAPFRLALERLGVEPARALHIGDSEADTDGARAAGLAFAPVPLATLPRRLGLER